MVSSAYADAGIAGYMDDCVEMTQEGDAVRIVVKVKYRDADGDAPPAGYPRVRVFDGGTEVAGGPFVMTQESGIYASGAIYTYGFIANPGASYSFRFEASDVFGATATGLVGEIMGPVVAKRLPGSGEVKLYHGVFNAGLSERCYLMLNLSSPGDMSIEVRDVRGRAVRRLHQGALGVGLAQFEWVGKDDAGNPSASGTYWITVEGSGVRAKKKAVLIR